jgi:hypothetical protein
LHLCPLALSKEGKMPTTATHDGTLPFEGYDKLEGSRLTAQLRQRSQVELTYIDDYERANQGRPAVLNKLRYLRHQEPIDGYDGLDTAQILAALSGADATKLAAVRRYELKLRDRHDVMSGLAALRTERATLHAPATAPAPSPAVEAWARDAGGGLRGGAATLGVVGLMTAAVAALLVLLAIMVFVMLTAFAPDVLSG